jgi:sugar lactone lactonase YvrE
MTISAAVPRHPSFRVVHAAAAELGEGAIWDARDGRLYWVDILAGRLHAHEPATGKNLRWEIGQMLGTVVPRAKGGLARAVRHGFAAFWPDTSRFEMLARPPGYDATELRFNDGKCDPAGRFWAGTMAIDEHAGAGTLYCLTPEGRVLTKRERVSISNGLVWRDRRFYYIDSSTRVVQAFDYEPATGEIVNPTTAIALPPGDGFPDGSTLDAEGMLWIAHWGASKVSRWDPERGERLAEFHFPASQISSCAFGGHDLATLYVTSARVRLTPEQLAREPEAGSLFAIEPGVKGVPAVAFAG